MVVYALMMLIRLPFFDSFSIAENPGIHKGGLWHFAKWFQAAEEFVLETPRQFYT